MVWIIYLNDKRRIGSNYEQVLIQFKTVNTFSKLNSSFHNNYKPFFIGIANSYWKQNWLNQYLLDETVLDRRVRSIHTCNKFLEVKKEDKFIKFQYNFNDFFYKSLIP